MSRLFAIARTPLSVDFIYLARDALLWIGDLSNYILTDRGLK